MTIFFSFILLGTPYGMSDMVFDASTVCPNGHGILNGVSVLFSLKQWSLHEPYIIQYEAFFMLLA